MSFLKVDSVALSFAGVRALDGVSIEAEKGDFISVIGPNGAGKTSLFNCISGVYRPQSGSIHLDGTEITKLAPHKIASAGVARMFQNLALFDNLTVLDNLLVGRHHLFRSSTIASMLWLPSARKQEESHREKVEEIIEFLNLETVRSTYVQSLPYGFRKRVELGRALAMEPQLLLLDEPTAGLNQEETEDMARYLLDIQAELGVTQILIEHELRFVMDLSDHINVLDFGRKIAEGTPSEVAENPAVIEAYVGVGAADNSSSSEGSSSTDSSSSDEANL
ncbi:MAG: ABC transporter ATP-binding protein [Kofleriaceae bacterium]|nr:ABC transporter ATP-binding protein [Kofleriaceae bacterium]